LALQLLAFRRFVRGESRRVTSIGGGGQGVKIFVGNVLLLSYNNGERRGIDMGNIIDQLQDAINEALIYLGDRKNEISSDVRVKCIVAYITGAMSYVNGTKILMAQKQFDSVLPLCRSFLEMYAIVCYLMEKYNTQTEFDDYLKKLIVDDMEQDRKVYNSFKSDVTIQSEKTRRQDLESYIQRWENFINQYFPLEVGNIDQNNKELSVINIVKRLYSQYQNQYQNICGDKSQFIGSALKNNKAFLSEFGHEYDGSYVLYRLLCNETHGNIGAVDVRTSHNGYFSINISNENRAMASAQCMLWCLKDIACKFNELFTHQNVLEGL